jgi:hypothetical protein
MTIEKCGQHVGVDVHLEPSECELFIRLASDLERLHSGSDEPLVHIETAPSYFSLSAELGNRIRALTRPE